MGKKIAVARFCQETCSFNPNKTTMRDFGGSAAVEKLDLENAPGSNLLIDGFCGAMRENGYSLEGAFSAGAQAGGPLAGETFTTLKETLLGRLGEIKKPDAVFLALHGAMQAENEFDPEGEIISEVRRLFGKDCFIGVSLDHHANVTNRMSESADIMVGFETQPHLPREAGLKAAKVMHDALSKGGIPRHVLIKIPMLAPQDNFLTAAGPMKEWFDLAREIENEPGVAAASTFPTQPWLDVPENGWSCLVYADKREKALFFAEKLALKVWDIRERFWHNERLSIPDAVAAANGETEGIVLLSDTGDAVIGGAPGDNMSIAAELLKHDLQNFALVPVVDDESFNIARGAGTGARITLRLGGKMTAGFSPVLQITGTVKAVAEAGLFSSEGQNSIQAGGSVLFESGQLKIAVMEKRDRLVIRPELFERLGVDVKNAGIAVLKTGSNFQHFDSYRKRLIRVDSPGATQSDLLKFRWKNLTRPMYPFDSIEAWRPGR